MKKTLHIINEEMLKEITRKYYIKRTVWHLRQCNMNILPVHRNVWIVRKITGEMGPRFNGCLLFAVYVADKIAVPAAQFEYSC